MSSENPQVSKKVLIAEKLFISTSTVDSHRKNLLIKFDAKNTAALVKIAIGEENFIRKLAVGKVCQLHFANCQLLSKPMQPPQPQPVSPSH